MVKDRPSAPWPDFIAKGELRSLRDPISAGAGEV